MNTNKLLCSIFLVVGLVFSSVEIFLGIFSPQSFKSHSTEIPAKITNIESNTETYHSNGKRRTRTTHDVYVEYYIDDVKYNTNINSYSSSMHIGGDIQLYVDNNDPYNAKNLDTMILMGYIFLVVGLIFLSITIFLFIISAKNDIRIKNLVRDGDKVLAKIINVEIDYSISINGRHPFYYICEDSNGRKYTSDSYTDKKTGGFPLNIGVTVPVYMDSSDNSNYFVDIKSYI